MRFTDLWIALPALPFLAVAVSIGTVDLGPLGTLDLGGPLGITLLLSLLLWGSIARVVRGATLSLREREFVDAARTIGASNTRIIVRHVLPNCVGPIIVNATLVVAEAILIESTLSFLGVRHPTAHPELGQPADRLRSATLEDQWWLTVFPGLAIFLTVLAVNFLGDGLRDAFDPRHRSGRDRAADDDRAPVLEVDGLCVEFATDDGPRARGRRRVVLARAPGETRRGRRRVGLGQDGRPRSRSWD